MIETWELEVSQMSFGFEKPIVCYKSTQPNVVLTKYISPRHSKQQLTTLNQTEHFSCVVCLTNVIWQVGVKACHQRPWMGFGILEAFFCNFHTVSVTMSMHHKYAKQTKNLPAVSMRLVWVKSLLPKTSNSNRQFRVKEAYIWQNELATRWHSGPTIDTSQA